MSTGSITPLYFTGVSKYSSDLQTILTRAVQIAQLPVVQMQNDESDALQKKQLLTDLNSAVSALGSQVAALGALGAHKGLSASSSDSSLVTATATGATAPASYSISNISSLASAASETSLSGYATSDQDQVSTTGKVDLAFGGQTYHLDITTNNNLIGLRDAINNSGAGVTASILTTGTGTTPNYLSVSANNSGATNLQLLDDPTGANTDLLTATKQGSDLKFNLTGIPVDKTTNVVNDVIPGLTFTVLGTTTSDHPSATLSLTSDRTQLSSALSSLVSTYNTAAGLVNAQIGEGAGLLSGDSLIYTTQAALRALTGYTSTGTITSLADLGIELDSTGKMSFNQTTLNQLTDAQVNAGFTFLGSASTGLGSVASRFTQISDPITGMIKTQQDSYDATDKRLSDQISSLTDRINAMQQTLLQQLQAADALLAGQESQQNMVTASVQSLNYVLYGYQTNQSGA